MQTPANDRYEDSQGISLLAHDQYFRELKWIEPLTPEEEARLLGRLERAAASPSNQHYAMLAQRARERLVEGYQSVIVAQVKRVARCYRSLEWMDLITEANLGMLEALDAYVKDVPALRGRFCMLVVSYVRKALWRARYDFDGAVRYPGNVASPLSRLRRAKAAYRRRHGVDPSVSELAKVLDLSEEDIVDLELFEVRGTAQSLQGLLREGEAEDRYQFESVFAASEPSKQDGQASRSHLVRQAVQHILTPREREYVEVRYGLCDGVSQVRTRRMMNELLGRRKVTSLEDRAKKRLREALSPFVLGAEQPALASDEDYYTIKDVADLMGVSPSQVRLLTAAGKLPTPLRGACRVRGRLFKVVYPKAAIDALLASSSEVA